MNRKIKIILKKWLRRSRLLIPNVAYLPVRRTVWSLLRKWQLRRQQRNFALFRKKRVAELAEMAGGESDVKKVIGSDELGIVRNGLYWREGDLLDYEGVPGQVRTKGRRDECAMVICCAFSGSHRILRLIIREALMAKCSSRIRWVLMGSTEDDANFIKGLVESDDRIMGGITENCPLGRKWQTCVSFAMDLNSPDLLCITGSADVLPSSLLDQIVTQRNIDVSAFKEGGWTPGLYASLEWFMVSLGSELSNVSGGIFDVSYDPDSVFRPLGSGRFYAKEMLHECKNHIFDSSRDLAIDDFGFGRCVSMGFPVHYYSDEFGRVVRLKGGMTQMDDLEEILDSSGIRTLEASFDGFQSISNMVKPVTLNAIFPEPASRFQYF